MSIFVSYSYASMDNEAPLFGNSIIEHQDTTVLETELDLRLLEKLILASFGEPDKYRWVVVLNWKRLPETVTGEKSSAITETLQA